MRLRIAVAAIALGFVSSANAANLPGWNGFDFGMTPPQFIAKMEPTKVPFARMSDDTMQISPPDVTFMSIPSRIIFHFDFPPNGRFEGGKLNRIEIQLDAPSGCKQFINAIRPSYEEKYGQMHGQTFLADKPRSLASSPEINEIYTGYLIDNEFDNNAQIVGRFAPIVSGSETGFVRLNAPVESLKAICRGSLNYQIKPPQPQPTSKLNLSP